MEQNIVIGYVYDNYGYYDYYEHKYIFEGTPEKIANFIMMNYRNRVVITDIFDCLVCETMIGGLIEQCPDQDFLVNKLLNELLPIQRGDYGIKKIEFIVGDYDYYDKDLAHLMNKD